MESGVALSDLALASECAGLSWWLAVRRHDLEPAAPWLAAAFAALAASSALGGIWHGFFSQSVSPAQRLVWKGTLLAMGLCAFALWNVAAMAAREQVWARSFRGAALVQLGIFAVLAWSVDAFWIGSANLALPVTILLVLYGARLIRAPTRPVVLGFLGFFLTLVAGTLQVAGITAFGLDPNTFFHLWLLGSLPLAAQVARPGPKAR